MEIIQSSVPGTSQFAHIRDYFGEKTPDSLWVPKMAEEGGWIVITSDGGKQSKKGDKLPELCEEHGVTHVVMSQKLHHKRSHEKIAAVVSLWEQIATLDSVPVGKGFDLRFRSHKGAVTIVLMPRDRKSIRKKPATQP
jgi:hypothetical protein